MSHRAIKTAAGNVAAGVLWLYTRATLPKTKLQRYAAISKKALQPAADR